METRIETIHRQINDISASIVKHEQAMAHHQGVVEGLRFALDLLKSEAAHLEPSPEHERAEEAEAVLSM